VYIVLDIINMEALLFKTNHRTTNFMKEENRKTKREDNIKRTKHARGKHVQDKRKISENLELTNGEFHQNIIIGVWLRYF